MPQRPPPKILPKVTYDPPFQQKETERYGGAKGGLRGAGEVTYNPMNYYNPLASIQPSAMDMGNGETAYPNPAYSAVPVQPPPNVWNPLEMGMRAGQGLQDWLRGGADTSMLNPITAGQAAAAGIRANVPPAGTTPPPTATGSPSAGSPTNLEGVGGNNPNEPAPMTDQYSRTQDAVTKNQNLTEQAKAAGNDKELSRLQAEWERIAPKAAKFGITAERLVNSYMQPGNEAAEPSLDRALGRAIADDVWASAATKAGILTGDPARDDLMWREHWQAMNKGGRDPGEGHPGMVQEIQARMRQMEQENQSESFGQYQQWLANQG